MWQRPFFSAQKQLPNVLIYHYMDDILVATQTDAEMQQAMSTVLEQIKLAKLEVAPEKVQRSSLWKYLGWRITNQHIVL